MGQERERLHEAQGMRGSQGEVGRCQVLAFLLCRIATPDPDLIFFIAPFFFFLFGSPGSRILAP